MELCCRTRELEQVASAIYCYNYTVYRPPDTSVVLDFNYEAHNAAAYKFNTSATFTEPSSTKYHISAKSYNRGDCDLIRPMSNLGAVRHFGFDRKWIFLTILRSPGTHNAPACQISTQPGSARG